METTLTIIEYEHHAAAMSPEPEEGRFDMLLDCMMVMKDIEDGLLEEIEQVIGGEREDDREKRLVMVSEEGWMS
nr:hypothetical protein [Tanacetum cinerariifolium]